ncbi:U11/U12 small nuclear ribonucleoprotein 25 kDa protein [Octopus sinensis]|uniref:U11/U12 small nuclear ribonucleoprotein 25 kDa protein n=1 Tax=Octopus sinensis TaxID=2607531 RepID=A0A6P7SSJ7_9MOLL|nr:U11/U12 small nuclear ribonucleoprotein 25 kDa protein [Octopus sinensis]XP_036361868.1 U11/U12 small nuclear ribonucleoprotein 25 kDa protein [Octopus sinensis]XP_036361869.1 U11/U12 small nuclear ribonucleoprotein 25 kDa protein [Octopus sinensis]
MTSVCNESPSDSDSSATPSVQELTHQDAMAKARKVLSELICTDPLLEDLPSEVTAEEVKSQIALEYGQAMLINVCRADGEVMRVVVVQDATVLDLKHAIKRYVQLKQARQNGPEHISWRYIWKRYWLYFDGQKLSDDSKPLKEYGIRNKADVTFKHRLKQQGTV